jgi:filamentous hemagglutinin
MNRHVHRLVFNARRGTWMAVAETARAHSRGRLGAVLLGGALLAGSVLAQAPARAPVVFASQRPAPANPLPRPAANFLADPTLAGRVSWQVNGNTATFNQGTVDRIVLNWDSFDIGAGRSVEFIQNLDPTRAVSALNRVWSADPSLILGSLKANREIVLVNPNGVYFGPNARVDTGRLVASTLAIADAVFERGLRNTTDASPVFTGGENNPDSAVAVQAGAVIRSAAGGDVLLVAPRVINQGTIDTPQGQTVLAAGRQVYLMSSSDPRQRGLIVAADPVLLAGTATPDPTLGLAENAARGIDRIQADGGSVNLVGLAVRQAGQINATTAVRGANGSITLQAMASTQALQGGPAAATQASQRGLVTEAGSSVRVAAQLGTVEFAAGSGTQVLPSTSGATQIDAEAFYPSRIRAEGQAIAVGQGASITAPGGRIELLAASSTGGPTDPGPLFVAEGQPNAATLITPDNSRIVVAPGARISAAGEREVAVDGARNQGSLRLFRIELADAPVQRDGPLYRSAVSFDVRNASSVQVADVDGALASVGRTAAERSTRGGTVRIASQDALVIGEGAEIDVSGGSVRYSATTLQNTLLASGSGLVQFSSARAGSRYDTIAGTQRTPVAAYSEGADGGALQLAAPRMVLEGSLRGGVTQGTLQRDGQRTAAAPARLEIGRIAEALPLPRLTLDGAPASAGAGAALLANPFTAMTGTLPAGLDLALAQVQSGGFGALSLRAADISQGGPGSLDLGVGGQLDMLAERLQLSGRFHAAGGSIDLRTLERGQGDITLAPGTVLDTAGRFRNDTALADDGSPPERLALNGGSVRVAAARSLAVGAGSRIDVSAGARYAANGSAQRGRAGSVTLLTSTNPEVSATLALDGAAITAFGFDSGGTLRLGTPALDFGGGAALPTSLLSEGGFSDIGIEANGSITLRSGTLLAPVLRNWQFDEAARNQASGAMRPGVVAAVALDAQLVERQPVNLSLNANRALTPLAGGASITVERGAGIELEPGARLALTATRNITVGASGGRAGQESRLAAQGGSIELAIRGPRGAQGVTQEGYLPTQALWLGDDAVLSASGIAQLRPDATAVSFVGFGSAEPSAPGSRTTGTVRGGGTVTLRADRGNVVTQPGSRIELDGAAALLDINGLAGKQQVARAAGTLAVSSVDSWALEGTVSAEAPRDGQGRALADGGWLRLALSPGGVAVPDVQVTPPYPVASRTLVVSDAPPKTATLVPGASLDAVLGPGVGQTPAALLARSGFSGVSLGAGDRIRFDSALALMLPLGVELNAPAIAALPGVRVHLSASRAQIGDASNSRVGTAPDTRAIADTAPAQDTSLRLAADTISVWGDFGLQGFSQVVLDAGSSPGGEIRLGASLASGLSGTLAFAGSLLLSADAVYAMSRVDYSLAGLPAAGISDAGSTLSVKRGAGSGAVLPPLSAFGALSIAATTIDQQGVLWQPFGALSLVAERELRLGDGSMTSVSGEGAVIPLGTTNNASAWVVGGFEVDSLPRDKRITLSAPALRTAPGARVSAAGGGEVQAWEFFAGVGGSTDTLLAADQWVVLPERAGSATLDAEASAPDPAQQGRQIVITQAGSGLPPGRYNLQLARYALIGGSLPRGAYLVRRATSDAGSVRAPYGRDDGGVVVNAYLTSTGSVTAGTPGERFVVEPLATVAARSEYRLSDISGLLAQQAAQRGEPAPAALPRDAGRVQITQVGNGSGAWQAGLDLAGGSGRGGELDVSAAQVVLSSTASGTTPAAGTLLIGADTLQRSAAASVLLGGLRSSSVGADGTLTSTIDHSGTQRVQVALGDAPLATGELLLAATQAVELSPGTRIEATGTGLAGTKTLIDQGPGALLAVGNSALAVQRTQAGGSGSATLTVGAGSQLSGASVALDTSGQLAVDATTGLDAGTLTLGAGQLLVGAPATAVAGASVLEGTLLDTARSAQRLVLRGFDGIGFAGTQDWAQRAPDGTPTRVAAGLVLDAPVITGMAGADGRVAAIDIAAAEVRVQNTTGNAAAAGRNGSGTLSLQALPPLRYGHTGGLTLGPGSVALALDDVALRTSGDALLAGTGGVAAQGSLAISAARLTAEGAAQHQLSAARTLGVSVEAGARTLGERTGQGASLMVQAAQVVQNGHIELPGGLLTIDALGTSGPVAVSFGAGSTTSVAGFLLQGGASWATAADPGRVQVSARQGAIVLDGRIDASAAAGSGAGGDGGRIAFQASGSGGRLDIGSSGALQAMAGPGAGDRGGSLELDLMQADNANALVAAATAGGIDGALSLRARTGDINLQETLRARRVTLSADAGQVALAGIIDARSGSGGVVALHAGRDVVLASGARIDAGSTAAGAAGGDVLLNTSQGRLRIAPGALVRADGDDDADGRILLRAAREGDAGVAIDALDVSQLQAGEVGIEAVRTYSTVSAGGVTRGITSIAAGTSSVGTAAAGATLGQSSVAADSTGYMGAALAVGGVLDTLGVPTGERGRVQLRAGIEVQSAGSLRVNGNWELNGLRPGGEAGVLTLRAAGTLTLDGSLSDGFASAAANAAFVDQPRSWSMRLAAGADLGGANPLALRTLASLGASGGDLLVNAGRAVRTGAGTIELAAARDIRFGAGSGNTAAGQVMVAGRLIEGHAGLISTLFAGQTAKPTFTDHGGRLELFAGQDIVAPEATQLVSNWLWRSGVLAAGGGSYAASSQLAWWAEFAQFRQTLGAFGGGNVAVRADRDIVNLQAMAPNVGWADSRTVADATVQTRGLGEMQVQAGRDVLGGQYVVGQGDGRLRADRDIERAQGNTRLQGTVLGSSGGSWQLSAADGLRLAAAVNITALPAPATPNRDSLSGTFYSWGDDTTLTLRSGGDLRWQDDVLINTAGFQALGLSTASQPLLLAVMPPTVQASAARGDITFGKDALLFASASGSLGLWAGGDLQLSRRLVLSDSDALPDARSPVNATSAGLLRIATLAESMLTDQLPLAGLRSGGGAQARLHAEDDLRAEGLVASHALLQLPMPAELSAGGDITGLSLRTLHFGAADQTRITAGGNIALQPVDRIEVAGPGLLSLSAGRQLNLGNAVGLLTSGNVRNPALPERGADITAEAARAGTVNVALLESRYLSDEGSPRAAQYRALLLQTVREELNSPGLGYDEALAQFRNFPPAAQQALADAVLAREFSATYLTAAAVGAADVLTSLGNGFEQRRADLLRAGEAALAAGSTIELPGRVRLGGAELQAYLASLRALRLADIDTGEVQGLRAAQLASIRDGWRELVARDLGSTPQALDALAAGNPGDATAQAWRQGLAETGTLRFERYRRDSALAEAGNAAALASRFGRQALPLRLALFDAAFGALDSAGLGSFVQQPVWPGPAPLVARSGSLDLTQSAILTERGGSITLLNPGGAINVGLKDAANDGRTRGVIARGGGNVFGLARDDFQVNTQRVFIVGEGNMTLFTARGDIDSGRGANTAVGTPPLVARRGADGVVFEVPAATSGSGLAIVPDASGRAVGTIGLYPAFGEILALDAFIRAPSLFLGASVRGADNLQAGSVGGAAVVPVAPPVAVAAPAPTPTETRAASPQAGAGTAARERNSLLTVELLGTGGADPCEGLTGAELEACRRRAEGGRPRGTP